VPGFHLQCSQKENNIPQNYKIKSKKGGRQRAKKETKKE
jgi:hypothetical protein